MKAMSTLKSDQNRLFINFRRQNPPSPPYLSATHLNDLFNNAAEAKSFNRATQIHAQLITNNYISLPFLFNNLVNLYANCGRIDQALALFSTTHDEFKNVIAWTTLITQLSHNGKPFRALEFFKQLRIAGICPNQFTFSAVLPACAETTVVLHGEQIHSLIFKHGFDFDVFVGSALVDMYAKCSHMESARKVFDEMPERNLVSWNSMIVGSLQNKLYELTLRYFKQVLSSSSMTPNQVTFSSVLSACANTDHNDNRIGKQIHGVVLKHGLISLPYVKNSLMDMYSKCGIFEDSLKLFHTIKDQDIVTLNIMTMGCALNRNLEGALTYFRLIKRKCFSPDEASFSSVLHAIANAGTLIQGCSIHAQIMKIGLDSNKCLMSSLITMYSKCGSLCDSCRVFDEDKVRTVVSWTSMISAFQQHGYANRVIKLFEEMLKMRIEPNYISYVCVLSACSHNGLIEEGFAYFNSMTIRHGLNPKHEHYAAIVDLLARSGQFDRAKRFIESMPIEPLGSVWGALLSSCKNYENIEMGRETAEKLFEIEPRNPGNYVLLSNIYAKNLRLKEADEVRRLMGTRGVKKEVGCSWIDVKNTIFCFRANDRDHPRAEEIYEILGEIEHSFGGSDCKNKEFEDLY